MNPQALALEGGTLAAATSAPTKTTADTRMVIPRSYDPRRVAGLGRIYARRDKTSSPGRRFVTLLHDGGERLPGDLASRQASGYGLRFTLDAPAALLLGAVSARDRPNDVAHPEDRAPVRGHEARAAFEQVEEEV